jgi:hypothetical protein
MLFTNLSVSTTRNRNHFCPFTRAGCFFLWTREILQKQSCDKFCHTNEWIDILFSLTMLAHFYFRPSIVLMDYEEEITIFCSIVSPPLFPSKPYVHKSHDNCLKLWNIWHHLQRKCSSLLHKWYDQTNKPNCGGRCIPNEI